MKLAKKISKQCIVLVLALLMAAPQITMAKETTKVAQQQQEVRLQDDFYAVVNKEWLENTNIKPGYISMSAAREVSDKCQEQIQELFAEMLKNESKYKDTDTEKLMINLYKNYLNKTERNKQGIEPIKSYLDQIKAIKNIEDVNSFLSDITEINNVGLYTFGIAADFKDSNKNAFYLGSTNLILGDSDYYNQPTEQSKQTEQITTEMLEKILVVVGYSKEEAAKKIKDAYAFERLLTPSIIGQEEMTKTSNIYEKIYNAYTLEELDAMAPNMKLKDKIKKIGQGKVNRIVLLEPTWLEALNAVYTEANIEQIKNYMEIKFINNTAATLSEDFVKIIKECNDKMLGGQGEIPEEQAAMQVVNNVFSDEVGRLYVEKYFSEEAKEDAEALVEEIIAAYKKKLEAVDWMTEETKKNAIKKLDTMRIKVGYPNQWGTYSGLEIKSYEEGGSYFENNFNLIEWSYEQAIKTFDQPIDKTVFLMAPQTVNAYYSATTNDITFPAGILQAPFYDVNRSKEENLGAIGVVIAHEISHAFDTTGAHFDENGNVKDWWTAEDYSKFEDKAQIVRDFYNNVTVDSGEKVDGNLTVGENIADITGMSCTLDILREMENPDYKAFFESWATIWRQVATKEYEAYLLENDVHSPAKIRVNFVVSQFQEFYDTYGVKEGDGMYIKPEDRLKVY